MQLPSCLHASSFSERRLAGAWSSDSDHFPAEDAEPLACLSLSYDIDLSKTSIGGSISISLSFSHACQQSQPCLVTGVPRLSQFLQL